MTEPAAEIKKLKRELAGLKKLITESNSQNVLVEKITQVLDQQAEKPKKQSWRGRELVEFPNGGRYYVTPNQKEAKDLVDSLVASKKLSTIASEAALNNFLGNAKIQQLERSVKFWAKQYYKSHHLKFPKREKREVRPLD